VIAGEIKEALPSSLKMLHNNVANP